MMARFKAQASAMADTVDTRGAAKRAAAAAATASPSPASPSPAGQPGGASEGQPSAEPQLPSTILDGTSLSLLRLTLRASRPTLALDTPPRSLLPTLATLACFLRWLACASVTARSSCLAQLREEESDVLADFALLCLSRSAGSGHPCPRLSLPALHTLDTWSARPAPAPLANEVGDWLAVGAAVMCVLTPRVAAAAASRLADAGSDRVVRDYLRSVLSPSVGRLVMQQVVAELTAAGESRRDQDSDESRLEVGVSEAAGQLDVVYRADEFGLGVHISLSPAYPLVPLHIESTSRAEAGTATSRKWLTSLLTTLSKSGSVASALALWKQSLDSFLSGHEPCPICMVQKPLVPCSYRVRHPALHFARGDTKITRRLEDHEPIAGRASQQTARPSATLHCLPTPAHPEVLSRRRM
uniref:E3 ubiquitin-protein ligase listerin n=1 Tax=Sexangularia sp. CB-2014 TaxID=1486929 RepID=A0A7S1VPW3_9EUKA|mmetsp:Transcript_7768/g.24915  ORF Transcript_7768/g.24915 Transcript_7768/m.24915 type:complete len:413 (+) Transcript_7768:1016-2254(+)